MKEMILDCNSGDRAVEMEPTLTEEAGTAMRGHLQRCRDNAIGVRRALYYLKLAENSHTAAKEHLQLLYTVNQTEGTTDYDAKIAELQADCAEWKRYYCDFRDRMAVYDRKHTDLLNLWPVRVYSWVISECIPGSFHGGVALCTARRREHGRGCTQKMNNVNEKPEPEYKTTPETRLNDLFEQLERDVQNSEIMWYSPAAGIVIEKEREGQENGC